MLKKFFSLSFVLLIFLCNAQSFYNHLIQYHVERKIPSKNINEGDLFLLIGDKNAMGIHYSENIDYEVLLTKYDHKKMYEIIEHRKGLKPLLFYDAAYKNYFFEDNIPDIEWKIQQDKKDILGYTCQKAIGDFRGREYTVWFTSKIPHSYGPWKLRGLPGLILEAKDDASLYHYSAIKIVLNQQKTLPKRLEEDWRPKGRTYLYKDYIVHQNNMLQEMRSVIRANSNRGANREFGALRELMQELTLEWEE